jgi:hypothetical protein
METPPKGEVQANQPLIRVLAIMRDGVGWRRTDEDPTLRGSKQGDKLGDIAAKYGVKAAAGSESPTT